MKIFLGDPERMSASSLEQKRVFLVALGEDTYRQAVIQTLVKHLGPITSYEASDGSEALMKLDNVPPHVLIVEDDLSKVSGQQVVDTVLKDRRFAETACIVASPPPEKETFVDEIVRGQVQFLGTRVSEDALVKGVHRALNFVAAKATTEFHLKFLSPGEQLIKEGDKPDAVYIVRRGTLSATLIDGKKQVVLGQIEPGEFVGEMAYINGEPRSADVYAVTDCELIEIPIGHIEQILFQRPAWSRALMQTLSKRVKRANQAKTDEEP